MLVLSDYINSVEVYKEEEPTLYAEFENMDGYGQLTLEQWGSDPTKKVFSVYICFYTGDLEVCQAFPVDCSKGWETMRPAYEEAARFYNNFVSNNEIIPLF